MMGSSAKGRIVFAVDLGDWCEGECISNEFGDVIDELVDLLAEDAGLPLSSPEGFAWDTPEYTIWHDNRQALLKDCPLEFHSYNHHEYPMWLLAWKDHQIKYDNNNGATRLPAIREPVPVGLVKKMKNFCEKHDLPWSEPAWYLVADYG